MARITVEDCLQNVDNRFDLVLLATRRARQLENGHEPMIDEEGDKPTVIALREISEGLIDKEKLDLIDAQHAAAMEAEQQAWNAAAQELGADG